MIQLDFRDRRPLYEQIREKIKELIIKGILKESEKIPSVRELAQSLTINPNTIQKAYRDLEAEGFIYSIRGKGNFVTPIDTALNQARRIELLKELEKLSLELMYINTSREELIDLINNVYAKKEAGPDD